RRGEHVRRRRPRRPHRARGDHRARRSRRAPAAARPGTRDDGRPQDQARRAPGGGEVPDPDAPGAARDSKRRRRRHHRRRARSVGATPAAPCGSPDRRIGARDRRDTRSTAGAVRGRAARDSHPPERRAPPYRRPPRRGQHRPRRGQAREGVAHAASEARRARQTVTRPAARRVVSPATARCRSAASVQGVVLNAVPSPLACFAPTLFESRPTGQNRAMGCGIRFAAPDDAPALHAFMLALATYAREPEAVEVTPDVLRKQMAAAHPPFECLLAERHATAVGFALLHHKYFTWRGRFGIYLEDLYVDEAHRGRGVGTTLLRRLA